MSHLYTTNTHSSYEPAYRGGNYSISKTPCSGRLSEAPPIITL